MTIDKLIRSAIMAATAVDSYASIDATDMQDALDAANSMLALWATKGVIVHHVKTEQFTLTPGTSTYTIGSGANFDTSRPSRIVGGFFRLNNIDYPLVVIDRDTYNGIVSKNIPGIPQHVYYYPSYPTATISIYYVPNQAYTMHLDSLKPLAALALDTDLSLPPEYEEAIKWNLAVRLAPIYGKDPRPDVVQFAKDAYSALSVQPIPLAAFEGVPGRKIYYGAGSINTL